LKIPFNLGTAANTKKKEADKTGADGGTFGRISREFSAAVEGPLAKGGKKGRVFLCSGGWTKGRLKMPLFSLSGAPQRGNYACVNVEVNEGGTGGARVAGRKGGEGTSD